MDTPQAELEPDETREEVDDATGADDLPDGSDNAGDTDADREAKKKRDPGKFLIVSQDLNDPTSLTILAGVKGAEYGEGVARAHSAESAREDFMDENDLPAEGEQVALAAVSIRYLHFAKYGSVVKTETVRERIED